MARALGVDYGKKRIGLAISDPLNMFATGFETIEETSEKKRIAAIANLITEKNVETVVMGLPLRTTGEYGQEAEAVKAFGDALKEKTGVTIIYQDERYTSVIAQQSLRAQGFQPSRDKGLVDQTAAALILQQYLDQQSSAS